VWGAIKKERIPPSPGFQPKADLTARLKIAGMTTLFENYFNKEILTKTSYEIKYQVRKELFDHYTEGIINED
jgi:hypothetical protein